ncbi:GNAT family N-acetyltransferase [Leuconostoc suionicum]|uniref:GNAT family N-acetyltransferase n=1 Tax=Leuconostoc suionicum TaxID=1511761 RepID=UPI0032DFAA3D
MDQYWNSDQYHVFLILANGEIAGFVMVREEQENEPNFIEQFFVLKYYSGKGVGKAAAK